MILREDIQQFPNLMVMEPYTNLSLTGKFFTSLSPPSIDRSEAALQKQWSRFLSGAFKVSSLQEDLISFDFEEEEDVKKVIEKGPWNIDGFILVFNEVPSANFWVKVEGLPLSHYTREESHKIAKRLSDKPLIRGIIDHARRSFWVRVEVDLTKPLKAGFFMGDQRKPHFVQFKYNQLGNFCSLCGKIDHIFCGKFPKERSLTRKFRTKTYGPWLRYKTDRCNSVKFEFEFEEKPCEYEETVLESKARLLVEFKIGVLYRSEHEWRGKTLSRSFLDKDARHCFCLPLPLLLTDSISNLTRAHEILSNEIDEIAPLVGLAASEKANVIGMFLDYLMKNKNTWHGRRWVPLTMYVTKQIMVSSVDCETLLQERNDEELHRKIKREISQVIQRRIQKNENLISLLQWMESIKKALTEIGVSLVQSELVKRAKEAMKDAIQIEVLSRRGVQPADKRRVQELEKVKVLGDQMKTCNICKEEMFLGEQATRMPCFHLFHNHCLEAWLETANTCPLCRFHLPNSDS